MFFNQDVSSWSAYGDETLYEEHLEACGQQRFNTTNSQNKNGKSKGRKQMVDVTLIRMAIKPLKLTNPSCFL